MTGTLIIDGTDVYTAYHISIAQGGYNGLVCMPPLKAINSNDWHEEDGIEPDLSSPVLNSREFTLNLICDGVSDYFDSFMALITDGAYHTFNFAAIGRTLSLRYVRIDSQDVYEDLGTFGVRFADDFPLSGYTYLAPVPLAVRNNRFRIDNKPISNYGLYFLQGTLDSIRKTADAKQNLLVNVRSQSGATYDGENVTLKSKTVQLLCYMTANSLSTLWRNYDALLYDLVRIGGRKLYVQSEGQLYDFYYNSCQVTDFTPDCRWLEFTLTVTFY